MTADGTPLVGVNISFVNNPLFGYTISRQDGRWDVCMGFTVFSQQYQHYCHDHQREIPSKSMFIIHAF